MKIAALFLLCEFLPFILLCAGVGVAQTPKPTNCIGHDAKGNCTALERAKPTPKPDSAIDTLEPSLGGRIDRLSDDEYAELQKLRNAVAAKEKEIAKAHGVDFGQEYVPASCVAWDMGACMYHDDSKIVQARKADTYEFRGQFLLVNVPNGVEAK